jgi:hypothetical protein
MGGKEEFSEEAEWTFPDHPRIGKGDKQAGNNKYEVHARRMGKLDERMGENLSETLQSFQNLPQALRNQG